MHAQHVTPREMEPGEHDDSSTGPDAFETLEHMLDVFRSYYGPVLKTFAALPSQGQEALANDFLELFGRFTSPRAAAGTYDVEQQPSIDGTGTCRAEGAFTLDFRAR